MQHTLSFLSIESRAILQVIAECMPHLIVCPNGGKQDGSQARWFVERTALTPTHGQTQPCLSLCPCWWA